MQVYSYQVWLKEFPCLSVCVTELMISLIVRSYIVNIQILYCFTVMVSVGQMDR